MRYAFLAACGAALINVTAAFAEPMPALPELPPLPTEYRSEGTGGFYAGIFGGTAFGEEMEVGVGVVAGNAIEAADLLLGVEVLAFAASSAELSVEGDVRVGVPVTPSVSLFGFAGLGYSSETEAFASLGVSLEADVGAQWLVRADYRYSLDLSGEDGSHKVLLGLVRGF